MHNTIYILNYKYTYRWKFSPQREEGMLGNMDSKENVCPWMKVRQNSAIGSRPCWDDLLGRTIISFSTDLGIIPGDSRSFMWAVSTRYPGTACQLGNLSQCLLCHPLSRSVLAAWPSCWSGDLSRMWLSPLGLRGSARGCQHVWTHGLILAARAEATLQAAPGTVLCGWQMPQPEPSWYCPLLWC